MRLLIKSLVVLLVLVALFLFAFVDFPIVRLTADLDGKTYQLGEWIDINYDLKGINGSSWHYGNVNYELLQNDKVLGTLESSGFFPASQHGGIKKWKVGQYYVSSNSEPIMISGNNFRIQITHSGKFLGRQVRDISGPFTINHRDQLNWQNFFDIKYPSRSVLIDDFIKGNKSLVIYPDPDSLCPQCGISLVMEGASVDTAKTNLVKRVGGVLSDGTPRIVSSKSISLNGITGWEIIHHSEVGGPYSVLFLPRNESEIVVVTHPHMGTRLYTDVVSTLKIK